MTTVAVIIPYFQQRPGILQRALASVLRQKLPAGVRVDILLIDDGSPVPARAEIDGLTFESPFHLKLVEQSNAGVGAARNAALNLVNPATDYIAFLDSDDYWHPDYLATALFALDQGSDFYFCDSQRVGDPHTSYSENNFAADFIIQHGTPKGADLYKLDPAAFFDQSLRKRVFRTPSTVYRRAIAPALLFDTSLRVAGEDCLFFFQLLSRCQRICCSTHLLATFGDGVNIHAGKFSWNDPGHLLRHMAQLLACYTWRDKLSLSTRNDRFLRKRIGRLRALFAFFTIRYFLKKRELWPDELRKLVQSDARFLWWYPAYCAYVALCFPLRLYDPLREW